MTRSWQFTLTTSGIWYNLWTLITADPSFTDPTFTNAPYTPSKVGQISIYGTTGNISISLDSNLESGFVATATLPYIDGPFDTNCIDLKTISLKSSVGSGVVNVSIVSK
jgi:hypothetical protein